MENEIVDEFIRERMIELMQDRVAGPQGENNGNQSIKRFLIGGPGSPAELEALPDGFSTASIGGSNHRVFVSQLHRRRYAVTYDISDHLKEEEKFGLILIFGGIFSILLSAWIGYLLSKKVIAPVTSLADLVESSSTVDPVLNLSRLFADDEMGRLARAFDGYLLKLDQFIQREKAFTADASHELRTPLTVIQSTVEMLLEKSKLGDKDRERLRRIDRAAKDMTQSLDALLAMARNPEKIAVDAQRTDINHCIEKSLEALLGDGDTANPHVEVTQHINAQPFVDAQESMVCLLISNILRNAFRYTPRGTIDITLENNSLTVRDTGVGIQAQDLARVFERGFRGQGIPVNGGGLGLSIAKRICDYYGWHIELSSREGEGTTVTCLFSRR